MTSGLICFKICNLYHCHFNAQKGEKMNWFLLAFKRTFDFKGRSRRREYGWFLLINFLIGIVLNILTGVSLALELSVLVFIFYAISFVYNLASFVTSISLVTRRLHDLGWSGWWQLAFYLVPAILVLASMFASDREMGGAITTAEMTLYGLTVLSIIIVFVVLFFMLIFKDGQKFENKYGASPKAQVEQQIEQKNTTTEITM